MTHQETITLTKSNPVIVFLKRFHEAKFYQLLNLTESISHTEALRHWDRDDKKLSASVSPCEKVAYPKFRSNSLQAMSLSWLIVAPPMPEFTQFH